MRNDKLIPGMVLVIIGAIFLLNNFGYIDFSWNAFFRLWPILLVIGGVNLVFSHNRSPWATVVKVAVLLVGMCILIAVGIHHGYRNNSWSKNNHGFNFNFDDSDENYNSKDSVVKVEGSGHYVEWYKPEIKTATLTIRGGATNYILTDTTNSLFDAETREYGNRYILTSDTSGSNATLDFNMKTGRHGFNLNFGGKKSSSATIKLNPNPEWYITVKTGATDMNFDLSKFKVKRLKLDGGAAQFNVKMGQPVGESNLDISTGISDVNISIPKNVACNIITKTGLSSKNFDGFNKRGDNEYETPGFANATNKIYIHIKAGLSDFKVDRY